jgi:Surface antigen variable number repeat
MRFPCCRPNDFAFASITFLLFCPSTLFTADTPRRIDRIEIVRKEIFDTTKAEDGHFIGSVVNGLHILTREDVVRKELLFKEGDQIDEDILQESARNLRALGYLGDVRISSYASTESSAVVTVVTQDRWSIDMLPAYKQEGGATAQRYTLKDDNFLGGGHSLSLSYSYQTDHPSPHGTDLILRERNLLGTRFQAFLQQQNGWEQQKTAIGLEQRYYSDRTPWAGGVYAEFGRQKRVIYRDGIQDYDQETERQTQRGWLSMSLGSQALVRPVIGYLRIRSDYVDPRVFDNLDLVTIGISYLDREFVERSYLNSSGRTEDMPLGFAAGVTLGKNFLTRGLSAPLYMAGVTLRHAMLLTDRFYMGLSASFQGYWGGFRPEEGTVSLTLLHHLKISNFQTFVAQVRAVGGLGWSGQRQLLLGSSTGLRGYAENSFAGDRMISYGLEHRIFTGIDLLFFRMGGALFLDGGSVWSGDAPPGRQRFSNAAGFGLRIENTKVQGAGLIRIDWAMNLDERRPGQIIISSRLPFSAFLDLDDVGALWSPEAE